jgi:ABC-type uncharacterized transport system substrate-binding protein
LRAGLLPQRKCRESAAIGHRHAAPGSSSLTVLDRIARPALALAALIAGGGGIALAHPHVFVDAHAELVFDKQGRMDAVRNIWQFDEAFTQFAIQGLDANNDGKLSDDELKPLADVNVKSLKEFRFFTYLTAGGKEAEFLPPKEYWLEFHNQRLTLFFTLPMKTPMAPGAKARLEIFDPEYFVAFEFAKNNPFRLDDAPASCSAQFHKPKELDAQTMAVLAAIPAEQHDLPPDLVETASALANSFTIACP